MLEINPQPVQQAFLNATQDIVYFGGGGGGGKALRDDQRVLTPSGWIPICELSVGDKVVTPKNSIETVTGVFPQGKVPLYKFEFLDGRSTIACTNHLWEAWKSSEPSNKKVVSTDFLIEAIKKDNWLIPTCDAITLQEQVSALPLDPYIVGCVLGDGDISKEHCAITSCDDFIITKIKDKGYTVNNRNSDKYTYDILNVIEKFELLGLKGTTSYTKYIPDIYKHSSIYQRKELIQGLMDTDGYVSKGGKLYYHTSSIQLAKDFQEIIRSLGGSASITEKYKTCNGKRFKSYSVYIKYSCGKDLVSLPRKSALAKTNKIHTGLRIKSITPMEDDHATCISISGRDKLFITEDYIVTHNTWSILVDNLKYVHDPHYFSVFFRNTTTEIETNLWPEALKMYRPLLIYQNGPKKGQWIGKARIRDKQKEIIFPSGAKSKFAFLELDKHADAYYGAEISRCYWDEFQKQSEYAFHVIRSRLRSKAQVKSQMRMTLNPAPSHFCYFWIKPYLDEEGFPKKELSGRTRYFLIVAGDLYTAWTKEELIEKFPDKVPQTYTYIPSTLEDNKVLMEMEAGYKDTLDSLPPAKRKQMLLGCWASNDDEGMLFQRKWLNTIPKERIPQDLQLVRAYDLASEIPTENNRHPDYSYGLLMGKGYDGYYYILGGHRLRERPGARNQAIISKLKNDVSLFGDVTCITAVDPGAGGKVAFEEFSKQMVEHGIKCKKDVIPTNKGKKTKYEPFSDACQNSLIYICEDLFDKEELELLYKENELFDGVSRSTSHRKDDSCDALGMAFNYLAQTKQIKPFSIPQINAPTILSKK